MWNFYRHILAQHRGARCATHEFSPFAATSKVESNFAGAIPHRNEDARTKRVGKYFPRTTTRANDPPHSLLLSLLSRYYCRVATWLLGRRPFGGTRSAPFSGPKSIDALDSAEPIRPASLTNESGLKMSAVTLNAPSHGRDLHNPLSMPASMLAAYVRLGHIRLYGDVAEWLKAAVC
jgi:hypothetical protein